jgi:hypothetical protein
MDFAQPPHQTICFSPEGVCVGGRCLTSSRASRSNSSGCCSFSAPPPALSLPLSLPQPPSSLTCFPYPLPFSYTNPNPCPAVVHLSPPLLLSPFAIFRPASHFLLSACGNPRDLSPCRAAGATPQHLSLLSSAEPLGFVGSTRLEEDWPGYSWRSAFHPAFFG